MTTRNVSDAMPLILRPWGNLDRLWRSFAYLAIGVPLGIVTFTTIFSLLAITASLLITVVFAIPAAWALFVSVRILGGIDRSRAVALLGIEMIDPVPPLRSRSWLRRLWERVRTRSRWREIANSLLLFPMSLGCWIIASSAWAGAQASAPAIPRPAPVAKDALMNASRESDVFIAILPFV